LRENLPLKARAEKPAPAASGSFRTGSVLPALLPLCLSRLEEWLFAFLL